MNYERVKDFFLKACCASCTFCPQKTKSCRTQISLALPNLLCLTSHCSHRCFLPSFLPYLLFFSLSSADKETNTRAHTLAKRQVPPCYSLADLLRVPLSHTHTQLWQIWIPLIIIIVVADTRLMADSSWRCSASVCGSKRQLENLRRITNSFVSAAACNAIRNSTWVKRQPYKQHSNLHWAAVAAPYNAWPMFVQQRH